MRRYVPLGPSRGTVIPPSVRAEVYARDRGCVGAGRFPEACMGGLELDHVRASHGLGMKSPSTPDNLVALCGFHHRWRTEHGRVGRAVLLAYLEGFR